MCCCSSKIHGRDIVLLWHQINILQVNQPCLIGWSQSQGMYREKGRKISKFPTLCFLLQKIKQLDIQFILLSFLSQFLYISTYKVIRMSNIVFGLYQKSNLAKQLESSLTLMFRSYYNDSTKNPIYFCK